MRDPDRAKTEHVGKAVVRQRSAEIGQNGRRTPGGLLERAGGETDPRVLRVEPAGAEESASAAAHLDLREAVAVEVAAQRRKDVVDVGSHTYRSWQWARACPGIALTGWSGVPVVKASTSKLFQPKTRSAGVSSASPQSRSIVGQFPPPSTSTPASRRRTDAGSGGRHSRTWIVPRVSVMQASACARTMPGLARRPPQLPE